MRNPCHQQNADTLCSAVWTLCTSSPGFSVTWENVTRVTAPSFRSKVPDCKSKRLFSQSSTSIKANFLSGSKGQFQFHLSQSFNKMKIVDEINSLEDRNSLLPFLLEACLFTTTVPVNINIFWGPLIVTNVDKCSFIYHLCLICSHMETSLKLF